MTKILLVEDEESILEAVKLNLELDEFQVETCNTGTQVLSYLPSIQQFDLVILDVMLPGINGIELCQRIREKSEVPILFLSAKGNTTDKILGLKSGANDYLAKPFDLEELLLRVQILTHQKKQPTSKNEFTIGSKKVDFDTFEVHCLDTHVIVNLSKKEIDLLQFFIKNQGRVVSRNEILDHVWGTDQFPTSRTIDNFILNFRKLFEEQPKQPRYFLSIRGVGYKFVLN